jgi:hypothetical protein
MEHTIDDVKVRVHDRPQPTTMTVKTMSIEPRKDKTDALGNKSITRAEMRDNTDDALAVENEDPRFWHTPYKDDTTVDLKRKFFKNTSADYLMGKVKFMEANDVSLFIRFIHMGKAMIDYTTEGDLENFKRLFAEADDKEMMFWHVSKCFKAAVKGKKLNMIEFMIEELELPLKHECFQGYFHIFLFQCQEAEMEEDAELKEDAQEVNRQIVRYLAVGYGRENIDQIDKANGSTPLIIACELLNDHQIVEVLVDWGCDVNAVNCDNAMPLNIIKNRLKKDPDNYELQDIQDFLKRRGAVRDWRKLTKNYC